MANDRDATHRPATPPERVGLDGVMATAAVRPATPEDVEEIVRIQSDTWTTAYAGLVPAVRKGGTASVASRMAR